MLNLPRMAVLHPWSPLIWRSFMIKSGNKSSKKAMARDP
jgi:hypothetical protein